MKIEQIFEDYKMIFTTLIVGIIVLFGVSAILQLWSIVFGLNLPAKAIKEYSAIVAIIATIIKFFIDMCKSIQ